MWDIAVNLLQEGRTRKVSILQKNKTLYYSNVIEGWKNNGNFRRFFISLLAEAPFPAYFWETPPVTKSSVDKPFEFVQVDSPLLAGVNSDPSVFEQYFKSQAVKEGIVAFLNLGRDAYLIVPCPRGPLSAYPHIAAFAREAPEPQQHALLKVVGTAMEQRLNEQPIWLSTSGLGVFWLHIRLDSYPKYYTFQPYKEFP